MLRVAAAFGVSVDALRGSDSHRHVVEARLAAYLILREQPTLSGAQRSYRQIAEALARSRPGTVASGIRAARKQLRRDPRYAQTVTELICL